MDYDNLPIIEWFSKAVIRTACGWLFIIGSLSSWVAALFVFWGIGYFGKTDTVTFFMFIVWPIVNLLAFVWFNSPNYYFSILGFMATLFSIVFPFWVLV